MKTLALATLLLATTGLVQAEPARLVNADGSDVSQLCIAAAASPDALAASAKALNISTPDLYTVRCNGLSIHSFASKYRETGVKEVAKKPLAGFKLKKSDSSPVTALCVASTQSEQEFNKVKAQYFASAGNVEAEVLCNGIPLKTFARKYRAPSLSISQR